MKNRFTAFTLSVFLLLPCFFASCAGDEQIKAIRERGVLRVGVKVDVPRFGYLNPATGEIEGMEIDLARAIAKDILGDENAVRFMNITAQTRGAMLDNGEIDIVVATFTITEERRQNFNFSRPYFTDELGYLLRADSPAKHPEDLNGKIVGVAQASTARTAFSNECARLGIHVTLAEYASYPEIKLALTNGEIDAFVADKSILYGYLDDKCVMLQEGFNPQQYGIAGKLQNDKLAARIDSLLETLEKNGGMAAIFNKWGL
jgi:putative glutamine transport system substrate-binding protein